MDRSEGTERPGIVPRVDRYDLTVSCHRPIYWPLCTQSTQPPLRRNDETDLMILEDILVDEFESMSRRIYPAGQPASNVRTSGPAVQEDSGSHPVNPIECHAVTRPVTVVSSCHARYSLNPDMPPKRKRSTLDVGQGPPRQRRARSSAAVKENGHDDSQQASRSSSPQRRGRGSRALEKSKSKTPNVDDDELLLSPSKPRLPRLAGTARGGKPRYFLEAVEITIPSRRVKKPYVRDISLATSSSEVDSTPIKPAVPRPKQSAKRKPFRVKQHATPPTSPSPKSRPSSPARLYSKLPSHLHGYLNAQKRAVLRALHKPPDSYVTTDEDVDDREPETNAIAYKQLSELLNGTVSRDEGNSCLVLGPRGSGKSRVSRPLHAIDSTTDSHV